MQQFYVYILLSDKTGKYYCGQTTNITFRIERHNNAMVKSTKHGIPWTLVKYVICNDRASAMKLEKQIKKRGIHRWLMNNSN